MPRLEGNKALTIVCGRRLLGGWFGELIQSPSEGQHAQHDPVGVAHAQTSARPGYPLLGTDQDTHAQRVAERQTSQIHPQHRAPLPDQPVEHGPQQLDGGQIEFALDHQDDRIGLRPAGVMLDADDQAGPKVETLLGVPA